LDYKKGNRVARFVKKEALHPPGWFEKPGIAPGSFQEYMVNTPCGSYRLYSLPGVFSSNKLDQGTLELLKNLGVIPGDVMLDLGCGDGIVGIVATSFGASWVDFVDSNLHAIAVTRMNLQRLGINNAAVFACDVLPNAPEKKYSLIASNPPFHSGQTTDYQIAHAFIEQSWRALKPGGRLVLVANRFIRYDRFMTQLFAEVNTLGQTGQYHVLSGEKQKT
jgi:16S rRNA (guanine1207-N2)-methyltransferase